LVLPVSRPKP